MEIETQYELWNNGCKIKSDDYKSWNKKWVALDDKLKETISSMLLLISSFTEPMSEGADLLDEYYEYFTPITKEVSHNDNDKV